MSTIRLRFYIAAVVLLTIRPANTQDKSLRDDADVVVCDAMHSLVPYPMRGDRGADPCDTVGVIRLMEMGVARGCD